MIMITENANYFIFYWLSVGYNWAFLSDANLLIQNILFQLPQSQPENKETEWKA